MDKKFKILVFIKQVPDTDDIKWTENNTIQREGLPQWGRLRLKKL